MKLVKKFVASVLAGAMMLSMAACTTGSVNPGTPDLPDVPAVENPTAAQEIVNLLNVHVKQLGMEELKADAELNDRAAVLLDAILDSKNNNGVTAYYTNKGQVIGDTGLNRENYVVLDSRIVEKAFGANMMDTPAATMVRFADGSKLQNVTVKSTQMIAQGPGANGLQQGDKVFDDNGQPVMVKTITAINGPVTTGSYANTAVAIDSLVYTPDDATKVTLAALGDAWAASDDVIFGVATKTVGTKTVAVILTETTNVNNY